MATKVKTAIDSGAVDKETGQNLTHRIFQSVDLLIGIGVTPPLKGEAAVDQRTLIVGKRDVKLLQSGSSEQEDSNLSPP
jgi:hypothetical protein